jgi:hypothetical protein
LAAWIAANPAGFMRPAAMSASTLSTFTCDQALFERRGEYRCR